MNFADKTVELSQIIIIFLSSSSFLLLAFVCVLLFSLNCFLWDVAEVQLSGRSVFIFFLLSLSQRRTTLFQIIFLVSSELERDYTSWPSSFDLHSLFILDSDVRVGSIDYIMIWTHERLNNNASGPGNSLHSFRFFLRLFQNKSI